MENAYKILGGKHKRKRLLGRPRSRWENNIKMNLGCKGEAGFTWLGIGSIGGLLWTQ
jgi:hypothetical protein